MAARDEMTPLVPLAKSNSPPAAGAGTSSLPLSTLRQAAQQRAQDDLLRRNDPAAKPLDQTDTSTTDVNDDSESAVEIDEAESQAALTSSIIGPSVPLGRRDALDATAFLAQQNAANAATSTANTPPTKEAAPAPTDSLSLGQLKQITQSIPKPKQYVYTFPSPPPDTSDLLSELEEFYSYVEVPQVMDHKDSFLENWTSSTEFVDTPKESQLAHIQKLLEKLSDSDSNVRFTHARNLLYVAQGTFHSSRSPENHLHLILCNVALLRAAGAVPIIWEAVKATGLRWEAVSGIPDANGHTAESMTQSERDEYLSEVNAELALYLAVLYFMMEVYRGDEEWANELMSLEPPMPIYLFNAVAGLREKNAKGYPVKKLLLLLWKSILACIGGMKDIARVKSFVRQVEGLPPDEKGKRPEYRPQTKVAPPDFQSFRSEISSKYPSYQAPSISLVQNVDRIAAAAAPEPVRSSFTHFHTASSDAGSTSSADHPGGYPTPSPHSLLPGTPAPSPPPSPAPKAKKQQFQTDQTKPFILPFAPANAGPKGGKGRVVPASIEEAGELYQRNMRISTELWQTWKLREEFIADESGILSAARLGQSASSEVGTRQEAKKLSQRMEALSLDSNPEEDSESAEEEFSNPMDPLSLLRKMAKQVQQEEENEPDDKKRKLLKQKREDIIKLQRVEQFYRAVLPQMQSTVIVLLKLLLATVTANNNNPNGNPNNADSGNDEPIELSLEDVDIMRHREITSKAVSAILILALKWFKTSHVMKFHYLSQLLVDSNCLLLILKMFGLQEVSTSIKTKNDRPEMNFFKYCHDTINPSNSSPRPEDAMLGAPPPGARPTSPANKSEGNTQNDDDVILVSDFSWRNFFSVINFVHILQKLTKRKTHRVLLLVQYKSSAILKRILKVSHPTLQLYVLKVIKSQVAYCGRKWRQSNMKVITAIYLNCRPDLRDEWLTGIDVDADVEESLPHEQALRALVRFFNMKHYAAFAPQLHRRSSAGSHALPEFGQAPPPVSPGLPSHLRAGSNSSTEDVFPPTRSVNSFHSSESARQSPSRGSQRSNAMYSPRSEGEGDDYGFDYQVEDLLLYPRAVDDEGSLIEIDPLAASRADWDALGDLAGEYDDISDSESVGSLSGLLGGRALYELDSEESENLSSEFEFDQADEEQRAKSQWEHLDPDTITALEEERDAPPSSPRPRRRSSTGPISPALRPILLDRDDDAQEEEIHPPALLSPKKEFITAPVDEVELIFGE